MRGGANRTVLWSRILLSVYVAVVVSTRFFLNRFYEWVAGLARPNRPPTTTGTPKATSGDITDAAGRGQS